MKVEEVGPGLGSVIDITRYHFSVPAGLPQVTLEPLQGVQNTAARLILDLNLRDHVTPGLHQLHWLPVRFRIQYKLCSIMHAIHAGRSPVYLMERVQNSLRSADSSLYVTPRLRTSRFGERAFSHAGPAAWNSLPVGIRDTPDFSAFKNKLKTHFFNLAYA